MKLPDGKFWKQVAVSFQKSIKWSSHDKLATLLSLLKKKLKTSSGKWAIFDIVFIYHLFLQLSTLITTYINCFCCFIWALAFLPLTNYEVLLPESLSDPLGLHYRSLFALGSWRLLFLPLWKMGEGLTGHILSQTKLNQNSKRVVAFQYS